MTGDDERVRLRNEYSAAMGDYQAATDALIQFDRELFDGPTLDLETITQEGQQFKRKEESAYRRLSRAREAYFRLPH